MVRFQASSLPPAERQRTYVMGLQLAVARAAGHRATEPVAGEDEVLLGMERGQRTPGRERVVEHPLERLRLARAPRLAALDPALHRGERGAEERRDVASDFSHAFGRAPERLIGLAVASDTDNTGEEAHAGFADLRFVARDESC